MLCRSLVIALVISVVAAACAAVEPELDRSEAELADGTPDAMGVLAFLNDSSTTFDLLDVTVALDRRAAANLIDARPFDSIDQVDAVSWVGPSAMRKLIDFARDNGWVPSGDDVLGVYDGVSFTVDQAERSLALVNDASESILDDDVGLDPRAVDSILTARPILSVHQLSELYWVGKSMLERIRDYDAPVVLGTDCASSDDCSGPSVYCQGRPHDGSSDLGVCRDLSNVPGASDDCSSDGDCLAGLACSGLTIWDTGYCRPHWMFASYTNDDSESLPMSDVVVSSDLVVRGLASVPEDIVVDLDIVHVEYQDLVVTLTSPTGAEDVLYDGPSNGGYMPSHYIVEGIPRDGDVNGRWTLKITNPDEHGFGTLHSWTLELSSRFD